MNKSNEKSDAIRKEGNEFFAQKYYYNAMLKYNESLCFAEPSSEMLGLAYANRSAIYFEMKLFEKCLRNISLAKQNQYSTKNIEVLQKREIKCLTSLKQTNTSTVGAPSEIQHFFKLSYPSHENLSFIADCLELKSNTTYGRHIVTNKTLKVGDIVAIEEPFCKIVQNRFMHQICSWCFHSNLMDLLPCRMCTKAMFCSEECKAKAFKSFHKYECPIREMVSILTTTEQMALRTFFTVLSIFGDSLEDLQKYLLEHPKSYTVFDFDKLEQEHKFLAINSLISSDETEVKKDIFKKIFLSPTLKEMWMSYGDFIENFLKHQTQIGTLNYHEIYIWPLKKGRLKDHDVDQFDSSLAYKRSTTAAGNGSYPFSSLLNHHCAPNINRLFVKDKITLLVQRPIKKGEQLFDNYGYNFTNVSKEDRQLQLSNQYRFKCNCNACKNDWSLLSALKICDKMSFNKAKNVCRELNLADLNRKKAIVKYKELCEIIDKNQKNFPSLELCSIMQSASAYMEMILKPQLQFS